MPSAAHPGHVPVAELVRGATVESVHYGSVAVVDREGRLLHAAGDPHAVTFTRSALKPLQALPFVAAGGIERFGYSKAQTALLCASHSGEPRHVEAVADMLARAGNHGTDLQCGTHPPGFYDARGDVPPPPPYSPLQHNCSGKHSGMLAWCTQHGAAKADYLAYEHPLQHEIRRAVATFTGIAEDRLLAGIDGCSAPNYAVPLSALARAFARLATADVDADYGRAPRTLADAMTAHPEMVSGAHRSDLALMEAGRGDWVTKIGAEGVQAIGIRSHGIGIAIKVADGQKRGLYPVIVAVLDALGVLDTAAREVLATWGPHAISNYRGLRTGEIRSSVVLDKRADR
ncbi:MAG TPA: asparaginase [Casimicrobiaceae bacterium]|jgi:L-asparaginase II|nr:asparaginase [Casimicrobiaceae bacterium]